MKIQKVNLADKFSAFSEYWTPKIVGELNGQHVKLAKFKDEFVMHHHEEEDEMFLVVKGHMQMELEDETIDVFPGEFIVIPKGVRHKPKAIGEAHVLLFEPASTLNTGDVENEKTQRNLDSI
jgi:mannose-6-phosphate isomerase-like protein (cupin superfamily)